MHLHCPENVLVCTSSYVFANVIPNSSQNMIVKIFLFKNFVLLFVCPLLVSLNSALNNQFIVLPMVLTNGLKSCIYTALKICWCISHLTNFVFCF